MQSSLSVLEALPLAVTGSPTLQVFDATGQLRKSAGIPDGTRVEVTRQGLAVVAPAGRVAVQRAVDQNRLTAVVSFDAADEAVVSPFLDGFFRVLLERDQVEDDMESINSSSLALLEEVSMVGDTLPRLPTGRSVVEVAEMGLRALVVAASVDRALYVQFHAATNHAEVLVQVGMETSGRPAVVIPFGDDPVLPSATGVVWDALLGRGDAVLYAVPSDGHLGAPGSPEALAQRELIVVPVHFGGEEKRVLLGALLVMDKRANAYSNSVHMGSQETKLATAIAAMLGSVLGTRKVAELGNELRMANQIQQQILPDRPAVVSGFELAGRCDNSGAVGGDYFDFLPMADGRTMVVVADVSGHNLASGMLMVGARSTLRALSSNHRDLAQVFDELARSLYEDLLRTERFITAVGAALGPDNRVIELVNAGHNDSIVFRAATGKIERLESQNTILGFFPEPAHELRQLELAPDDVLLLYTDGVVEATNPANEMMGEEGLAEVLRAAAAGSAQQILDAVFGAVDDFSDDAGERDDVTVVVIKAASARGSTT